MNWLESLAITCFAILAPIHAVMGTMLVLIITDLVCGMLAAHKRGEKLSSAALRRTVTKIAVYQCAIITGFLCEHYLTGGIIPVTKLVGGLAGAVETKSILENLDELNGSPIFATIIKRLGSQNDTKDK